MATYANVHDELRKVFAKTPAAKALGYKAGDFSYNTGRLRCPTCDGTGSVSLDVQFLPDVDIPCPDCRGSRYGREAYAIQMAIEGDVELSANAEMERNAAHETETASDMTLRRDGSWSALPTASHRASGQGATEVAPYGGSSCHPEQAK